MGYLTIAGIRGMHTHLSPLDPHFPDDLCVDALNIEFYRSGLARKRNGATAISLTGGTAGTSIHAAMFSFVPGQNYAARELWTIDASGTPLWKRLAGGTTWADVTVTDAVATTPYEINAVAFNGKLFFAYDSTVNRLHVWDADLSKVVRCGMAPAAAPTIADTGAGSYAATTRYYKVRYLYRSGSKLISRVGELSSATTFTPSGSGTAARVTKPASISEDESHWDIFGSADNVNFFRLTRLEVGTTTYDDSADPATYSGDAAPDTGTFKPPPSARYLSADASHLVMAGAWETSAGDSVEPKANRIWWTSALGSTDTGDDERISDTTSIKNYHDIDEPIVGLSPPIDGVIYVFTETSQWEMIPTGQPEQAYRFARVSGGRGTIAHKSILLGEDEDGDPALYWLSPAGPMRRGKFGQQALVDDIIDLWETTNLAAARVTAHGLFYPQRRQIWWWVNTSGVEGVVSPNSPDTKLVFDVALGRGDAGSRVRGGWSYANGASAVVNCSCLMSDVLGATMSRALKPYVSRATGTPVPRILKCDTGSTEDGTNFQAYLTTRHYAPWGLGRVGGMTQEAILVADALAGATITVDIFRDVGAETLTSSASIAASGSETSVFAQLEASRVAQANTIQVRIGDASAVGDIWNLDALIVPVTDEGDR